MNAKYTDSTHVDTVDNPKKKNTRLEATRRLGLGEESKKLANSLNGYLNIYKNHMMTAIRALDFYNNINDGKNCNEQGCKIND